MGATKQTQAGVQSLYPRLPESQDDNQFVPFLADAGTCCIKTGDMRLPEPIVENIRALLAREISINSNRDVLWFVPVIGQYNYDKLTSTDYTFQTADGQNIFSFSQESSFFKKVTDDKGVETKVALAEQTISLVDGNTSGAFTGYVAINDPTRLLELTNLWNTWISQLNVATFSVPLIQMGTEKGIKGLSSVSMTRHWTYLPQSLTKGRSKSKSKMSGFEDARLAKNRKLVSTPYAVKQALAESSQGPIIATAWEEILSIWILPTNYAISGETVNDQTEFQRWQLLTGEPFSAITTAGETGLALSTMHSSYAQKMVRPRDAPASEWDNMFKELAASGRGGVLTGLLQTGATILGGLLESI